MLVSQSIKSLRSDEPARKLHYISYSSTEIMYVKVQYEKIC